MNNLFLLILYYFTLQRYEKFFIYASAGAQGRE